MSNSKPAYSFNPENGEYCGIATAWESPLEPGIFYLPGSSTFDKPDLKENYKYKWNDKKWIEIFEEKIKEAEEKSEED